MWTSGKGKKQQEINEKKKKKNYKMNISFIAGSKCPQIPPSTELCIKLNLLMNDLFPKKKNLIYIHLFLRKFTMEFCPNKVMFMSTIIFQAP